ncbi:MAG: AAA family ATPase [Nanoarchaeota archaeon]
MSHLIVLSGLPGTGKTTLSRRLTHALANSEVISLLEIRRALGHKRYNPHQNPLVHDILHQQIVYLISQKTHVIVDSTNATQAKRLPYYHIAAATRTPVTILEMTCPTEVSKRRIRQRPRIPHTVNPPSLPTTYQKVAREWVSPARDSFHCAHIRIDSCLMTFAALTPLRGHYRSILREFLKNHYTEE